MFRYLLPAVSSSKSAKNVSFVWKITLKQFFFSAFASDRSRDMGNWEPSFKGLIKLHSRMPQMWRILQCDRPTRFIVPWHQNVQNSPIAQDNYNRINQISIVFKQFPCVLCDWCDSDRPTAQWTGRSWRTCKQFNNWPITFHQHTESYGFYYSTAPSYL